MVKKKDECLEQSTSNPTLSNIRHGQTSYTGSRSSMVIRHAGHFLHLSEQSLQRKQMAQRQYIMNRLWPDRLFKLLHSTLSMDFMRSNCMDMTSYTPTFFI